MCAWISLSIETKSTIEESWIGITSMELLIWRVDIPGHPKVWCQITENKSGN